MTASPSDPIFGEHRDPEEIREDIRETTADITETLEALQSKLQPEAIVAEAKAEVVDQALSVFAKARQHPAALAVVGVGAAVIIGRAIATRNGASILSLAVGAVIGVAAYRVLSGEANREEEDEGRLTQEINPVEALPTPATLS